MRLGIVSATVLFGSVAWGRAEMTEQEVMAAAGRLDVALERVLALQSDRKINKWALETPSTQPIDDAAFLRRVCVDLAGRLPTGAEVRAFVADSAPDKRARMIERLGKGPAAGDWRFQRLAEPLRVTDEVLGVSQGEYVHWLRKAMQKDMPLNELMAQLVGARGTLAENPAAGYLLRDGGNMPVTAAELARAFLAQDIHCAGCHDHPFSGHTQRGFYEFAACFNFVQSRSANVKPAPKTLLPGARPLSRKEKTEPGEAAQAKTANEFQRLELAERCVPLSYPANYKYRNAKPGDVVEAHFLPLSGFPDSDPRSAFAARPSGARGRDLLVLWLTGGQNTHFTSTAALRVWGWMFGVPGRLTSERQEAGVADPEPPMVIWEGKGCGQAVAFGYGEWLEKNEEFARALRREFERCDCRIGEFQRILANTQAYQREALPPNLLGQDRFLPAPVIRRLPAEVLWDAFVSWLPSEGRAEQWRSSVVPNGDHPLRIMGRGTRQWADESRPTISHSLARLMIAAPVVERVVSEGSPLFNSGAEATGESERVEALFLDILGRFPVEAERAAAAAFVQPEARDSLSGVAWALLNTKEFLFYH